MKKPHLKEIVEIINSCLDDSVLTLADSDKELINFGMDSITFVSIIVKIEEFYDFQFPDDKLTLADCASISKIYKIINKIFKDKKNDSHLSD